MNPTPEQQWTALSALYEEADSLGALELGRWLDRLDREGNPLVSQLRLMLEARAQVETDDFMGTLPRLGAPAAAAVPQAFWRGGQRVGVYRLVRPLGEGGMAEVWLAERDDGAFKRQVAIKLPFPRPGRETFAARFDRERDILATLRHPNVAGLFDAGVTPEGQAWLALEYVEGEPLSTYCDRHALPVRERVALFRQVLLAVQYAHANLVIHRDLKPANILVTEGGEVRLLDFGIAKLLEAEGDAIAETELTRVGGQSLTLRYASPEQLLGRPLTIACDVYSLGVVFYELLCGERPYELKVDSSAVQLEHAILEIEPRPPSRRVVDDALAQARGVTTKQLRQLLAPELDAVTLRCLEKQASARYSSVDALLADVDRWLAGEAVLVRGPSTWYRFGKFTRRHRLGMALGATAVASLVAATAAATIFALQARDESARAVASRDFMLQIFRGADREKSRGAEITARELLDAGRRDVLTRLAGQPGLQYDLLAGIASIQFDMGEYAAADETFGEVARLAQLLGRSYDQAMALARRADTALQMGDGKRAADWAKRAGALSTGPASDTSLAARLSIVEGWLAIFDGRFDDARRIFLMTRNSIVKTRGVNDKEAINALSSSVYVEKAQRRFAAALALQSQLETVVRGAAKPDFREIAEADSGVVELMHAAGRYQDAIEKAQSASAECTHHLGPNDRTCWRLTLGKLRARLRMGFADGEVDDIRVVDALAGNAQVPVFQVDALYTLLRLESARGPTARQRMLFAQAKALTESSPKSVGIDIADRIKLTVGLAESALLIREPIRAIEWADQALELQGSLSTARSTTPWTSTAMAVKGIATRLTGHPQAALPMLEAARNDMCAMIGDEQPMCRMFALNVAATLADLGQRREAADIVRHQRPIIETSFGARSPVFARLLAFEQRMSQPMPTPRSRPASIEAPPPDVFL